MTTASLAARPAASAPPSAAVGSAGVHRFWDAGHERWAAKVAPGEYYVTRDDEVISTVLGSCISACIRDPVADVGGMNHFMLPECNYRASDNRWLDPKAGLATRYGSYAMESLLNSLLELGARRERLEIKLFGAGRMLTTLTDVGQRNIEFVRQYLQTENLEAAAEDLGDTCPRRIAYFPASGKVRVWRLPPLEASVIAARECRHLREIGTRAAGGGDVELF
jgi:chemotaxis protein CheD